MVKIIIKPYGICEDVIQIPLAKVELKDKLGLVCRLDKCKVHYQPHGMHLELFIVPNKEEENKSDCRAR